MESQGKHHRFVFGALGFVIIVLVACVAFLLALLLHVKAEVNDNQVQVNKLATDVDSLEVLFGNERKGADGDELDVIYEEELRVGELPKSGTALHDRLKRQAVRDRQFTGVQMVIEEAADKQGQYCNASHNKAHITDPPGYDGTLGWPLPCFKKEKVFCNGPQHWCAEQIHVHNGKLKIKHTGVYYVYAQLTFYVDMSKNSGEIYTTVGFEMRDQGEGTILRCVHGGILSQKVTSCFTASVQRLEENDKLQIWIKGDSTTDREVDILTSPDLTYFGVMLLNKDRDRS